MSPISEVSAHGYMGIGLLPKLKQHTMGAKNGQRHAVCEKMSFPERILQMDKQNVTLSLPRSILRKAKKIAIDQDRSLSGLMVDLITEFVEREDEYASARRQHLALLDQATDLGTNGSVGWTRRDLHER